MPGPPLGELETKHYFIQNNNKHKCYLDDVKKEPRQDQPKNNEQQKNSGAKMQEIITSNSSSSSSSSKKSSIEDGTTTGSPTTGAASGFDIARTGIREEICKGVLRKKLSKMRHLVVKQGISPAYLDSLFPTILELFAPQTVMYNGGIANVKKWKISCYLEVMEGGVPCTDPNVALLETCLPLLSTCDDLFVHWYRQQHACNNKVLRLNSGSDSGSGVKRLMTFITRYTPAPGEEALLKHVDGAGKVDGSVVVALPIDRWSGPEEENSFEGHGGGLTFWDGRKYGVGGPQELQYHTRSGDIAFIDRAVWHQANPISKGTRWALVIFYRVL